MTARVVTHLFAIVTRVRLVVFLGTLASCATTPSLPHVPHRITAGEGHTCVLEPDGMALWCWGRDSIHQTRDTQHVPQRVALLRRARSVVAADGVSCVIFDEGSQAACLGDDMFGQLTTSPSLSSRDPLALVPFPLPGQPMLGMQGACAVNADVRCWGEVGSSIVPSEGTRFGHIAAGAQGKSGVSGARTTPPVKVAGIDGAIQVAFGVEHLCALMPDGRVRCLGRNRVGQLGRVPVLDDFLNDAHHEAVDVEGLAGVVQLEANLAVTCARTMSGAVWCWGSDYHGQLGARDRTGLVPSGPHDVFRPLPRLVEGLPPATQISVGGTHVCAVVVDGRVFCWGQNEAGQLGNGSLVRRDEATPMTGVIDAVDVAASDYGPKGHTCVLRRDGVVSCTGRNDNGALAAPADVEHADTVRLVSFPR